MRLEKITHQEILKSKPTVTQIRSRKRLPVLTMFENIRSRANVGAMFRTSDAALVGSVFLGGTTPHPPHKEIDKTALGAADVVPWQACRDVPDQLRRLKSQGVSMVALELTHQSVPYDAFAYSFPVCLVVGNEVDGISQAALDCCDHAVSISMLGRANSLNVASAYAVAVFEILRQYKAHLRNL